MVFFAAPMHMNHAIVRIALAFSLTVLLILVYQLSKSQKTRFLSASASLAFTGHVVSRVYNDTTTPIFPPIARVSADVESDLCSTFPREWLEKVQVVFKTGVGESEKSDAHLASVTSCIENLIVVSDLPERRGGHNFIDVLATLPSAYLEHPDFATYHAQREGYENGDVGTSSGGWKLDRFKFLPMVDTAHEMRPNASWYVFLEADVYIFWDSLFRLLDQYDPHEMHYFGSAVAGANGRWFAYGGAGIVISQGLMMKLVGDGTRLSERYQQLALNDCCGDAVLSYAIDDKTGVKLENFYPMFSGEDLQGLGVNKERWCTPLISLHRMSAESLNSLWKWERTRRISQRTVVLSDMVAYRQPDLPNSSHHDFWDNLSGSLLPKDNEASQSASKCEEACKKDDTCLQFSYTQHECRLWPYIVQGHEVGDKDVEFTSGWDRQKIRELGLTFTTDGLYSSCDIGQWIKPTIHWWSYAQVAAGPPTTS